MIEPNYPNIVFAFDYRGFKIEIDQDRWQGQNIYSVWANYDQGCAIAVRCAFSRQEAARKAKRWVDQRLESYKL
ncbi:MAG: hypothetical protein F6K24_57365 [Okeania sp. SIO2D1]|nr:hypothetical protein [Okeania sp. SIO2D1]